MASPVKELREKESAELVLEVSNLRKELFDLRFQSTTEKIPNPSRISAIKKTVAQIRTIQREREIAAAAAAQDGASKVAEGGDA